MILEGQIIRDGAAQHGWLEIKGERIERIGQGPTEHATESVEDLVIAPGFVDLQVNGAVGREVTGGSLALDAIDRYMLSHGVTSYLPTVITTDAATAQSALDEIALKADDASSPVIGAHLEGPFLNPQWRGVHRREQLRLPTDGVPSYYQHPAIKLVTLAPELPGAIELCAQLSERGVTVAVGHSAATPDNIKDAIQAGAKLVTHLFNAMPPFHHRNPGLAGWTLAHDELTPSLIADGHHVAADALRLAYRATRGKTILVSDASVALGTTGERDYMQAGLIVHLEHDGVRTSSGAIAGGAAALDECVRYWAAVTGARLGEVAEAASTRPADAICVDNTLTPGKQANLVLLDRKAHLVRVMHRGRWVDRAT